MKIGDVIEGRYKILRPLAEGGMGTVFLAEHWLIKRKVALKFLRADLAADATMIRRFMNEALAAGTLGHPNIVEATDMGFGPADLPYIVYEYLEGTRLADEVAREGPLPVPRALRIAHQIAGALDAAHEAGIVHRDLKSDNIYLTERQGTADHVKVLDFGISRFLAATDRTGGGALIGTPEFMAPEQVLTPDAVDKRADIYALGILVYEMLAGRVPFVLDRSGALGEVEAAHALLDRILKEAPPPLVVDDAPAGLAPTIHHRLLAKDPDLRFQSMKEVQRALERFADEVPSGPVTIVPRRRTRSARTPLDDISDRTVSGTRLTPEEIAREVKALGKRWSVVAGDLQLDVYDEQLARLAQVIATAGEIADDMGHLPRIVVEPPHLVLSLRDASEVVDLVFAARLEQWLRTNGW
ncbi:MAG: serine/threonine-protein kinase [Acidobacteriota bacterium]